MTDYYQGLKGIYFYSILHTIKRIGKLDRRQVKILDFGSGLGKLKKILGKKVTNYDIQPSLSEVKNWQKVKFDVLVANEVFYQFTTEELVNFLRELRNINPKVELIVGIARQNLLGKTLKHLAGVPDAHTGTNLTPRQEIQTLCKKMFIVDQRSVFFLCDVYILNFKRSTKVKKRGIGLKNVDWP